MLPDGWVRTALGEIARIASGGTPDRAESSYWGGDIPWVTTSEIRFNTITNTTEKITAAGLKNSSAKLFPAGTLLMAMYGQGKTRGQVAKLGIEAATNQACAAINLQAGHDIDYFFQVLAWKYDLIRELGNAGTQQNLNAGIIKEIEVPVPESAEQRRIAQVLACWDGAISESERLLANLRRQKQALLARTLRLAQADAATRRLPGGSPFPSSVQAGIPKLLPAPSGWRRTNLGMHLREARRPLALDREQTYRLVTVRRSRGGVVLREVLRGREIKTPSQFEVRAGDFLISKRQIVHGACGIVPAGLNGAIVSNEYAVLNTDGEIDLQFLRYLSESIYFQQTCFHSSIGVHVEKMIFNTERWLSWPFNIPPLGEQRHIVQVLDASTAEIACVERQVETLKMEKRALMASLLTGKRRLCASESAAETAA